MLFVLLEIFLLHNLKCESKNAFHIIPNPQSVDSLPGHFILSKTTRILLPFQTSSYHKCFQPLQQRLNSVCGYTLEESVVENNASHQFDNSIIISTSVNLTSEEAYHLTIKQDRIIVESNSEAGLFYAFQTLRQLLSEKIEHLSSIPEPIVWSIPCGVIADAPQYEYRGLMLDCSRHFFSVNKIKTILDIMAYHKLNRFHWHLTDDQGWRLQLAKYPSLTEIGAFRANKTMSSNSKSDNRLFDEEVGYVSNGNYGGFYTSNDVKAIVSYAESLFITVIPEIEIPGHAAALLASIPSLSCDSTINRTVPSRMGHIGCVCCVKESVRETLANIIVEARKMFGGAGTKICLGGDEVTLREWLACKECTKVMKDAGIDELDEMNTFFLDDVMTKASQRGRSANKNANSVEDESSSSQRLSTSITSESSAISFSSFSQIARTSSSASTSSTSFSNTPDEYLVRDDAVTTRAFSDPSSVTVIAWRGEEALEQALKSGHDVVSTPVDQTYFDFPQTSKEAARTKHARQFLVTIDDVYSFLPAPSRLSEAERAKVLGGEGCLWTEYVESDSECDRRLFPRTAALAEALWSSKERKNREDFQVRLKHIKKCYEAMGINYYE